MRLSGRVGVGFTECHRWEYQRFLPYTRRILRRAVMVVAVVVLLVVSGCGNLLEDLVFVLPAGYSGPFVVVEDPNAPEIPYQNGAYTIHVPESGVVRVKSASILSRETDQSARRGSVPLPLEGRVVGIGDSGRSIQISWDRVGLGPN